MYVFRSGFCLGLPFPLVCWISIAPEWLWIIHQPVCFSLLDMVVPLCSLWPLFSCCSRKFFQRCPSNCCLQFWWMINKGCSYFRCPRWYCHFSISNDRLDFCTHFSCSTLDLHYYVWKIYKPNVVSLTTLLCLMKCNSILGPVKFFFTMKCSATLLSPLSSLCVAVVNGLSNWPFVTWV